MKIFIGMETSGALRSRFATQGHEVVSCDLLPPEDDVQALQIMGLNLARPMNCHIVGDIFEALDALRDLGWWPDLGIFHPECTYHTLSAAWAFADPDFDRYPGVGYHQRVRPGTLVGRDRRLAREKAEDDVEKNQAATDQEEGNREPARHDPDTHELG